MKVALLSYEYSGQIYGGGRYSVELAKALEKIGVDVKVFTPNKKIKKIGPFIFSLHNRLRNLSDFDVIHSIDLSGLMLNNQKHIVTIHHDYSQIDGKELKTFNFLFERIMKKAFRIIVPSHNTFESLNQSFRDKARVIYHGVNHKEFFKDEEIRVKIRTKYDLDEKFVILNVGRYEERKGHKYLLEAIEGIENVVLVLVGRNTDKIIEEAKQRAIPLLQFDYIPNKELNELYNASDLYIHTALLEGFGLTVVEAMSTGTPVIVFETSDFREIVKDGGIIIEKTETKTLRKEIFQIMNNSESLEKMSYLAWENSKRFTWEKTAKAHLEVYNELIK